MDAKQFAELERAMNEEHRREREMLQYLKERLVHGRKNGRSPITRAAASLAQSGSHDDGKQTIINKVESIMTGDPSREWDRPKMVEHLKAIGFPLGGDRPGNTINRVFRKLVKRGKIKRVQKGAGTNPNVYRGVISRVEVNVK